MTLLVQVVQRIGHLIQTAFELLRQNARRSLGLHLILAILTLSAVKASKTQLHLS